MLVLRLPPGTAAAAMAAAPPTSPLLLSQASSEPPGTRMGTPATDLRPALGGTADAVAASPSPAKLPSGAAAEGPAALRCAPLLLVATRPLAGRGARWLPEGGGGATTTISGSAVPPLVAPPLFQGLLGGGCLVRCLVGTTTVRNATHSRKGKYGY
jgi:hypothetical protein